MKKEILKEIQSINSSRELQALKEEVDNEISTREEVISICETANSLKGRSFGYTKESIEALLPNIFSLSEGKNLFNKYVSVIKEDKRLKDLYNYYENLDRIEEGTDAMLVINELKKQSGEKSRKATERSMRKLDEILAEAFIWSGKDSEKLLPDAEREKYYSLAEGLFYGKRNMSNIAEYCNNVASLKEMAVKHNKERNNTISEAYSAIGSRLTENMASITDESLSEQYDSAKSKCLKTLDEAKNGFINKNDFESSARIELYIESVNGKKFNKDTAVDDINNFNELEGCFK